MTVVILLILLGTAGLLLAAQHAEITTLTRTVNYLHAQLHHPSRREIP